MRTRCAGGAREGLRARTKYDFVRTFLCTAALEEAASVSRAMDEDGLVPAADQAARLDEFGAHLSELGDKLASRGIRQGGSDVSCMFARRTGAGHRDVELAELSGSEAMLVLVAATIHAFGLAGSLLLIDAPELGMHPEDQVRMFEGLQRLMRDGQLIVATSSPAILRSVSAERVVLLAAP